MLPRPPPPILYLHGVASPASMVTLIARQTTFPVARWGICLQVTINLDTLAESIAMPRRACICSILIVPLIWFLITLVLSLLYVFL